MTGKIIYNIEYTFDDNSSKNGNIHRVVYDGKHVTEFTYNEMNELTGITHPDSSTETLTYDNNGNLTQTVNNTTGETTAYEWDCFDRLMKVTLPAKGGATSGETVEFEYDSSGMLIGEKSGGMERKFTQQNRFATREVIKNGQDEWETSAMHVIHGTMLASYIGATSRQFGGKQQISHDTKTIFYHTNHLGSVRLITDNNGNIVNSSTTDAYGNPLPRETALPGIPPGSPKNKGAKMLSEFNFIGTHGIRYVEKVKLHNMRARWYVALEKVFISTDQLTNLDITNMRYYANNNPIIFIDILGLDSQAFLEKQRKTENDISSYYFDEDLPKKMRDELLSINYTDTNLKKFSSWDNAPCCDEIADMFGFIFHPILERNKTHISIRVKCGYTHYFDIVGFHGGPVYAYYNGHVAYGILRLKDECEWEKIKETKYDIYERTDDVSYILDPWYGVLGKMKSAEGTMYSLEQWKTNKTKCEIDVLIGPLNSNDPTKEPNLTDFYVKQVAVKLRMR